MDNLGRGQSGGIAHPAAGGEPTLRLVDAASAKAATHWDFVDGLRAIAVLSVVLYHAGLKWLPGGYVGVDVFFVISGYLIIGQIVAGLRGGNFSFSEFWSRRALRILPSYFLVILASAAIAPFVLVLPGEYEAFANEVAYSALMVANHLFLDQQGYFDSGADTKVLLHLWSLSVEEQFYIVAPLMIAAVWRFPKALPAFAVVAFCLSLAGCIYWTGSQGDKNYAFFLMPLRVWEFIAGGAIAAAVPFVARLSRPALDALAITGLVAIAVAVLTFGHRTPFPSYWAALPVFGSCAVILAGLAGPNVVRSMLATRPMVGIGLVSYAWYLWHWPLLTFGRIYNFGDRIFHVDVAMIALSFVLAVATYVGIERPIRRARERRGKPLGWRPAWGGATVCVMICLGGYMLLTARSQAVASQLAGTMLPASPGNAGVCDLRVNKSLDRCKAQFEHRPIGVLIGDSQAAAATRALVDHTSQHDVGLTAVASGGCISLLTAKMRIPDSAVAERCGRYRDNARRLLATAEPEFAILYSYWNLYAGGVRRGQYYFIDQNGEKTADQRARFISDFDHTIQYLKSLGIRRILVIGPTPSFPKKAPECVVRATRYGQNPDHRCSKPKEAHDAAREAAMEWLGTATAKHDGVRMIDPSEVFCDASFCRPYGDGYVLFNDTNHISDAGVRAIIEKFTPAFDWVTAGR